MPSLSPGAPALQVDSLSEALDVEQSVPLEARHDVRGSLQSQGTDITKSSNTDDNRPSPSEFGVSTDRYGETKHCNCHDTSKRLHPRVHVQVHCITSVVPKRGHGHDWYLCYLDGHRMQTGTQQC